MKLHNGDAVIVISGKDKGKQGTVVRVLETKNRVVVEGINMRVRHIKKTTQAAGQRIKYEASIHASNVMIVDPKSKKPTRVGYKMDSKGKKVRFAKASGEVLPLMSKTKAVEPKGKKKAAGEKPEVEEKKTAKKTEENKNEVAAEKVSGPSKQAFWKRAFSGDAPEDQGGETRNRQDEIDKNSPSSIRRSRESS